MSRPTSICLRFTDVRGWRAEIIPFLLFVGGYVALVAWFKSVDVYHTHFSDPGVLVLINNAFRVLFIFYLFWIVQAAGALLLRLLGGPEPEAVGTLDYLALTFFAGTGPWHVVLLAVGYANLLNVPVMMILTLPMVALSFRELRLVVPGLQRAFAAGFKERGSLFTAACIGLGLVWGTLLLVKGLYPGGSQEYYVQYFPGYRSYLEHGGLWPNEAWLNYFYSKGAGLFFLGMLLTDPLAPQLVIFCLFSVAGLAIFLFARRLAPGTGWPMAGVALFFATYIYTPGWGEFGKLHEFNTAFVIAILWMTAGALGDAGDMRRAWLAGVASAVAAAIVVNIAIGLFLGAVFAALSLAYVCLRERRRSLVCLALAALAGAVVAGIMLINFATTGLFNDLALIRLWKFADVETLYRWGALPMVLAFSNIYTGAGVPFAKSANFLQFCLRLGQLWPLFLGGALAALGCFHARHRAGNLGKKSVSTPPPHARDGGTYQHHRREYVSDAALVLIAAMLVFVALTVTEGRGLSSSYYRFSSFMVPVVIVAGIALWSTPLRHQAPAWLATVAGHPGVPALVVALCAILIVERTRIDRVAAPLGGNALKHAVGILSIDDTFGRQFSGHGIMRGREVAAVAANGASSAAPRSSPAGIYAGARGAYAIVGPHTPIWSMHLNSYCMLPDCKVMTFPNFIMTRSWDRVMWGTPEEGRELLRAAGLNYFLYSRELLMWAPLALSALFSPDNIARYLGILWTDGTTTLLTWAGPDTTPLGQAWLADYRQSAETSPPVRAFPNARMKAIFERLNATPHPWRSVELPYRAP
ncbi:MAG: hypothetical protein QOI12_1538 [Alphaproteobacteria bacterium]|nr:hypothetical protein [Alphaproteobacteria bacterium]